MIEMQATGCAAFEDELSEFERLVEAEVEAGREIAGSSFEQCGQFVHLSAVFTDGDRAVSRMVRLPNVTVDGVPQCL